MSDETNECKFELQPLYCDECGAYVGALGTCEDRAWCNACNSKVLKDYNIGKRNGYDAVYSPQFEKGKPPMRQGKVKL